MWRGGAAIMMRAVLEQAGRRAAGRRVWAADSFAGIPPPDAVRFPADAGSTLHSFPQLAVDLESVKRTFARYGLLDDRVVFLPGRFSDTLAAAPVDAWQCCGSTAISTNRPGRRSRRCIRGCRRAAMRSSTTMAASRLAGPPSTPIAANTGSPQRCSGSDAFGVYWIKEAGAA